MVEQSKELTEFYRAYLEWAESGYGEHPKFHIDVGLCLNLQLYYGTDERGIVCREMLCQFIAAGLHGDYPFNSGNSQTYWSEIRHRKPARIAWVKEHAKVG